MEQEVNTELQTSVDIGDASGQDLKPEPVEWYQQLTLKDAKSFIQANIASASRSFIAVGYYLKFVRDKKLYVQDEYESVWDFANVEYGISKSTASRYMTMNDRFSKNNNSPIVAEEYKGFGKSQLQEMLYLTDEQMEQVTPDAQVKQIRAIRNTEREIPYIEIPGQMSIHDFPDIVPPEPVKTYAGSGTLSLSDFGENVAISQQEEPEEREFVCDTCLHDNGVCCSYPETQEDYCVMGDKKESAAEVQQVIAESKEIVDGNFIEIEPEEPDAVQQPELPILKNNDQRGAFVDAHETWPLWIDIAETEERYYRYDLPDGNSMVVKVYFTRLFDYAAHDVDYDQRFRDGWGKEEYYLLEAGKHFKDCAVNKSLLIEHLKEIQRQKVADDG